MVYSWGKISGHTLGLALANSGRNLSGFAAEVGVTRKQVHVWLRGGARPRPEHYLIIVRLFPGDFEAPGVRLS